jgi:two-component system chemotaxis response regulator CheY
VEAQIGSVYYEAKDGKEAISKYIAHKPQVVLMDIVMPNVDGIKATQAIRKYDSNAKIIVISTKDNQAMLNATVNNGGANDYVVKPIVSASLAMIVSKQLTSIRRRKV